MKKFFSIFLVLILMLSLVACGKKGDLTTQTPDAEEEWPTKPITVVVPWKSGGGADSSTRLIAKYWERQLGQTIVIENREGGDAVVGASYYFGQKQDGNTVLMMAQPFYSNMLLSGNVSFKLEDYVQLGIYEVDPSCLAVMPDAEFSTLEELDAVIKENPGKIKFGVNGGSTHLIMMNLLIDYYGWDVKVVFYDGASESRTALMGGHVDVIATTLAGCTEEIPLVIGASERNASFPDVPTYNEITGSDTIFATTRMFGVSPEVKAEYPDRYEKLVTTLKATFDDEELWTALEEANRASTTIYYDVDTSNTMFSSQHALAEEYWDILSGN